MYLSRLLHKIFNLIFPNHDPDYDYWILAGILYIALYFVLQLFICKRKWKLPFKFIPLMLVSIYIILDIWLFIYGALYDSWGVCILMAKIYAAYILCRLIGIGLAWLVFKKTKSISTDLPPQTPPQSN